MVTTTDGFGKYSLRDKGARAKRLRSIMVTFREPDEVWEDNPSSDAKWTYIKEFDSKPYKFSIAFVDNSYNEAIFAPTSCIAIKSGLGKWRNGKRIHP